MLRVKLLSKDAKLPTKGSKDAAGYDLYSAHESVVPARGKGLILTDIAMALPEGVYGRIAPRSGLAWKKHTDIGAGVVDKDYRGNVGIVIFNHSSEDFLISKGDRVAQLILECYLESDIVEVKEIDETSRGKCGFGSTGVSTTINPSMKRIIGLHGRKGVGKSSAAAYLAQKYGYKELTFASPLKRACKELFDISPSQMNGTQEDKERIDDFWGISPRQMFQEVGTAIRNLGRNIFTRAVEKQISESIDNELIVVSDVRFPDEAALIKEKGGYIISIERDSAEDEHESENQIISSDYVIENYGNLKDFFDNLKNIVELAK